MHGRYDRLGRGCIGLEGECIVLIVFAEGSDIAHGAAWSIGEGQFEFRLVGRPFFELLQSPACLGSGFGAGALLHFPDGPSNTNNALRTLRRILNMCVAWGHITRAPRVKLVIEHGRDVLLAEVKLISAVNPKTKRRLCSSILRDVIILMRETGMRNVSELYKMRIENISWDDRTMFNPKGKSKNARRLIPMSERAI